MNIDIIAFAKDEIIDLLDIIGASESGKFAAYCRV
jgi:hypothetical protein